ncbi:hypothetical protein [Mesorhizobium sp.]|uniref:hypothetical protein n=1 Tax=Mesorhizobium sp. TaxID=1871066 RepID=UPI003BAAE2D1
MADPFDRDRFAATVRHRLGGVSVRQVVDAFPALNVAMITRAKQGRSNLSIGSFLTICKALRLRPLDFYVAGVKRARVTRKTILKQTVTRRVPCETRVGGDVR